MQSDHLRRSAPSRAVNCGSAWVRSSPRGGPYRVIMRPGMMTRFFCALDLPEIACAEIKSNLYPAYEAEGAIYVDPLAIGQFPSNIRDSCDGG